MPTAQASSFRLQYFRIMCDVPSTAVFCTESVECFPGMASKYFFKPSVTNIVIKFTLRQVRNILQSESSRQCLIR
jgi:hypothetical protein